MEIGSRVSKRRPQLKDGLREFRGDTGLFSQPSLSGSWSRGSLERKYRGRFHVRIGVGGSPPRPGWGVVCTGVTAFLEQELPLNLWGVRRRPGGRTERRGVHQLSSLPRGEKATRPSTGLGTRLPGWGRVDRVEREAVLPQRSPTERKAVPGPRQHILATHVPYDPQSPSSGQWAWLPGTRSHPWPPACRAERWAAPPALPAAAAAALPAVSRPSRRPRHLRGPGSTSCVSPRLEGAGWAGRSKACGAGHLRVGLARPLGGLLGSVPCAVGHGKGKNDRPSACCLLLLLFRNNICLELPFFGLLHQDPAKSCVGRVQGGVRASSRLCAHLCRRRSAARGGQAPDLVTPRPDTRPRRCGPGAGPAAGPWQRVPGPRGEEKPVQQLGAPFRMKTLGPLGFWSGSDVSKA